MMMKTYIIILIALFLFQSAPVYSWWDTGHMVVANIAEIYLIKTELKQSYDKFNSLITAFSNFTDGKSNSFIQAACWPDDIKEYNATFFDNYHFINIVYDPQYKFVSMDQYRKEAKDVNSISVLQACKSVLKTNKQGITFERGFMARFLLHLVGDIHQPLHSVAMFNDTFSKGDQGGNLINITVQGNKTMNLHAFMDSMAGQQKDGEKLVRPLTDTAKTYLRLLAESIMKQYPPEHFGSELIQNNFPHDWAVEGYNAAIKQIYPFVFKTDIVTDEWNKEMFELCRQRVALAGYRLAHSISSIYK